jgi:hypothetical protein
MCFLQICTAAETTLLVVKTAAAFTPPGQTISPKSGLPDFLTPQCNPAAKNPFGEVIVLFTIVFLKLSFLHPSRQLKSIHDHNFTHFCVFPLKQFLSHSYAIYRPDDSENGFESVQDVLVVDYSQRHRFFMQFIVYSKSLFIGPIFLLDQFLIKLI